MQRYVGPASLISLLFAAIRLDRSTYRRVALEPQATHQCLAATLLAAVALGFAHSGPLELTPVAVIPVEMLLRAVSLLVETAIIWTIGSVALRGRARFAEVLRPLALAGGPGVLYLVVALAGWVFPLPQLLSAWLLVSFVVGIRAALDCRLGLAICLAVAVWAVESGTYVLLGAL